MQEFTSVIIKPTNTPQQKASSIPREVAVDIVDGETGALFEYQHLSTHPKYRDVETLLWQWNRMVSTGHAQMSQRNKHNIFHQKEQSTQKEIQRCHIWAHCI